MTNVTMKTSGDKLTITVDLSKDAGPSKSGKSIVIASTQGNKQVKGHDGVFVGLNVYRKIDNE